MILEYNTLTVHPFSFFAMLVFIVAGKLSLVSANRGDSLVTVHRFFIAVAFFIAEHLLAARGFSCPTVHGIFLDQGLSPWQADT